MITRGNERSGAIFSSCESYRYSLWRFWGDSLVLGNAVAFIGLNPSTADEWCNDPTVTRCINFARHWGYDGMVMLNAFAFRATDPRQMKDCLEPIGKYNDTKIQHVVFSAGLVVCCWGNHGTHLGRSTEVRQRLRDVATPVTHLGLTRIGEPKHPLYLRSDTEAILWHDC